MDNYPAVKTPLRELIASPAATMQDLIVAAYEPLVRHARSLVGGRRGTADALSLVHRVILDMFDAERPLLERAQFENDGVFFAYMAKALRHKLIDLARERRTAKRGGGAVVSLSGHDIPDSLCTIDYVDLHEILEQLEAASPRHWQVCELKFFCGMTNVATAEALAVSVSEVERQWRFARSFIERRLE
ncbi:MAG: ECF-type sigma factor [Phycisphaerae bacterium]